MGIELIYIPINRFKMLQYLINLCNRSYEGESWKEVDMMFWILAKIDMKKVIGRVWEAMDHPEKQTKVVLCEYNYTTKHSVEAGYPNVVDRLPNGVLVHDAMYRRGFIDLMDQAFCVNDKIVWYRRRKITREGMSDVHRMQVVLVFKQSAFAPPPPDPSTTVCRECDGNHYPLSCSDLPPSDPALMTCRQCEGSHWTLSCPNLPSTPPQREDTPVTLEEYGIEVSELLASMHAACDTDCYCRYCQPRSETAADVL